MNRLDHLHELFEARGDASAQIQRDLGDVRRRVRRRRQKSVLAGTIASIVVVSTVALVATAIGAGGKDLNVRSLPSANRSSPTQWQPAPYSRLLPGGITLNASMEPLAITFGPYGTNHRWTQPADCPSPIDVTITGAGGSLTDLSIGGLTRTAGTKLGLAVSPISSSTTGQAPTILLDEVVAVIRPVGGATYRLLNGTQTLDQVTADGGLIALYGQIDTGLAPSTPNISNSLSDGVHVQQLSGASVVADRRPIQQSDTVIAPSPHCVPPSSPSGLAPAISAGSPTAEAISAVIASMTPTSGSAVDGLTNVEDRDGKLHSLLGGSRSTRFTLTAASREIHLVSPTHAWVRYGMEPASTSAGAGGAEAFSNWAELHKIGNQWKVTAASYCVVTSTINTRCPDQPISTPIPEPGQPLHQPSN